MTSGLVSVMPHACSTNTPSMSWNFWIVAWRGRAAREHHLELELDRSSFALLVSSQARKLSQIVGMPPALVQPSVSSSRWMLSGSSFRTGQHEFGRPSRRENGIDQALAWNSGTMTRMESLVWNAMPSAAQAAKACSSVERWL